MSRRSLLGEVYNKVGRVLGTRDPRKQKFPVLEEHTAGQQHAASAVDAHATVKKRTEALEKEFKIYRWNPDNPNNKPYLHSYFLDLSNCGPMVFIYLKIALNN